MITKLAVFFPVRDVSQVRQLQGLKFPLTYIINSRVNGNLTFKANVLETEVEESNGKKKTARFVIGI